MKILKTFGAEASAADAAIQQLEQRGAINTAKVDAVVRECRELDAVGVRAVLLFGIPDEAQKDAYATVNYDPNGIVQRAAAAIKDALPNLLVIADLCNCEYTDHGHCGILDHTGPEGAVIDVGGVGYLVFASTRTLGQLPPPGGAARLLVETHVREDHIHLYGFIDAAERDWFRLLTTVQGVGARLALAILSVVAANDLTLSRNTAPRSSRRPVLSTAASPAMRSRRWSISVTAGPRRSAPWPRLRGGWVTAPRSTR